MEKKHKIIIGALVVIIAILACLVAFTLMPHENPDEVVKLGKISFNITNTTNTTVKFKVVDKGDGWKRYLDNTEFGRNIVISEYDKMDAYVAKIVIETQNTNQMKEPSQTINGIVVYTTSATTGAEIGKPMYQSYIKNNDLNIGIRIATTNPNETAKIASTLKFND